METVDLTKVAGFKALDSDGNELGIVSMEQLTDSIAMRIADGLSERTVLPANNVPMAVAATSTGSDKMETAFSETTDPAYVRVIDKNGNSAKQGISSLASVVGGLIGLATSNKNGLASKDWCFPKGGTVSPNQTIDDLEAGIYSVGAGNDNIPGSSTGVLFVDINLAYGYRIQRFYDTKGNKLFRINSGTWGVWK
jgi:hypothetical protein